MLFTRSKSNYLLFTRSKSNYMLFTRSTSNFSTRLKLNSCNLQRVESMKLLGVWITENLDWATNTREICKKSYPDYPYSVNSSLLVWTWKTWLEFTLRIYVVFLSTVNHIAQEEALERVQNVSLKVILGPVYVNYQSALSVLELETLPTISYSPNLHPTICYSPDLHPTLVPDWN